MTQSEGIGLIIGVKGDHDIQVCEALAVVPEVEVGIGPQDGGAASNFF